MQNRKAARRVLALAGMAVTLSASLAAAQLAPAALKQAQENFQAADAGGDGALPAAEFKAFIDLNAAAQIGRAAKIQSNNAYDRAFGKVDANGDGKVTWDEYLAAQ